MTVYVVQNQRKLDKASGQYVPLYDISPAKEFGDIVFILGPTAKPFINPKIIQEIHDKMENFGDDDYILLIGNPALIGMVTAIAANYNEGNIKFLQWGGGKYIEVIVEDLLLLEEE